MKPAGTLDRNELCFPDLARPAAARRPSRPVVDAAGQTWPSTSAAARAYRLTTGAIRYRALNGVAGWHFPTTPGRNPR
jgi:hypothetical protein